MTICNIEYKSLGYKSVPCMTKYIRPQGVENRASRPLSLNAPLAPKRHSRERIARAVSRGFIREYQNEKEDKDNIICYHELAPTTLEKYEYTVNFILYPVNIFLLKSRFMIYSLALRHGGSETLLDPFPIASSRIFLTVVDSAFKGHTTIIEVLTIKPPKGREL
ncbi:hypothetical protein N7475_005081 [Penicillium sp. IBT 31633x]|nr:hypothetical protein N7475_005081 [Penicillium sp. IBT 31633x]